MTPKAVIFDLFETLVHYVYTDRWEGAIAHVMAAGVPRETWLRCWHNICQVACREPMSLRQRVLMALREAGYPPADEALIDRVAGMLSAHFSVELPPDVRPALAELRRRGYRLGIITNMPADERFALEAFALSDLVDATVISYEVGLAKPDPAIFRLAAARLALPLNECVFIDDVAENVDAARQAGLAGVLIARPGCGETWGKEGEYDLRIASLQELLDWLPQNPGE